MGTLKQSTYHGFCGLRSWLVPLTAESRTILADRPAISREGNEQIVTAGVARAGVRQRAPARRQQEFIETIVEIGAEAGR